MKEEFNRDRFIRASQKKRLSNPLVEIARQLRANKKWWLLPIVLLMIVLALFIALAGTGAAPFIYTFF